MPRIRPVPAAVLLALFLGTLATAAPASAHAPSPAAAATTLAEGQAPAAPADPPVPGTDDMYWD